MAGLTDAGYEPPTLDDLLESIATTQRLTISPNVATTPDSLVGLFNAIFAKKLHEAYEEAEGLYYSSYPNSAAGFALNSVSAITGTRRREATFSEVDALVTLQNGFGLSADSVAYVDGDPTMKYATLDEVPVNNTGVDAAFSVRMRAVEVGPRPIAFASELTVIDTPVSGWVSVTNPLTSSRGLAQETDAELRLRRETELANPGTGTIPAIIAAVQGLESVDRAVVFANYQKETNAAEIPGHAIEVLVRPALDLENDSDLRRELWDTLFANAPAGKFLFGSEASTSIDAAGNAQPVAFTIATKIEVYVRLTVRVNSKFSGIDVVKEAIDQWSKGLSLGQDLYESDIVCVAAELPGVVSVDTGVDSFQDVDSDWMSVYAVDTRSYANVDSINVAVSVLEAVDV